MGGDGEEVQEEIVEFLALFTFYHCLPVTVFENPFFEEFHQLSHLLDLKDFVLASDEHFQDDRMYNFLSFQHE